MAGSAIGQGRCLTGMPHATLTGCGTHPVSNERPAVPDSTNIISELYSYHAWANKRVLALCDGLGPDELDEVRPMGFGTLRGTLFHMLAAERLWIDRWRGGEWTPLETDPAGISISDLRVGFRDAAREREELLTAERPSGFTRKVSYQNLARDPFEHPIGDLLMHVANHGIHHRAQALNFLRRVGRTVPGGLDYIFYKLAFPTVAQEPTTVEGLTGYGLEVEVGPGVQVQFEQPRIQRYFEYTDWAVAKVVAVAGDLDDQTLDRKFEIGHDTIRKTILHLYDGESWWLRNWHSSTAVNFDKLPLETPLKELEELWATHAIARNKFVAELTEEEAQRVVTVRAGGPPTSFRVVDSLLQLNGHGTHHRAQVINMLRQCDADPPALDYIVWMREEDSDG